MAMSCTNNNPRYLFGANAAPVVISGLTPGDDYLEVEVSDGDRGQRFPLPTLENMSVDLRGIIKAAGMVQPGYSSRENNEVFVYDRGIDNIALVFLDAHQGTENARIQFTALKGGIAGKSAEEAYDLISRRLWLTQRPQVNRACRWGDEQLFAWIVPDGAEVEEEISVTGYAKIYTPTGVRNKTLFEDQNVAKGTIIAIPASYAVVVNDPTAVAWDIHIEVEWGNGQIYESSPVRFVLSASKANWRGFVYRNALGGFDSVYSTGAVKVVPQYEPVDFRNDDSEFELDMSDMECLEVDTGMFGGAAARMQWLDFLRSTEKYLVEQDGTVSRIILDEASPELDSKTLGHFTFRFHKALDPVGNDKSVPEYESEMDNPGDTLWLDENDWLNEHIWPPMGNETSPLEGIEEPWHGHKFSEVEEVIKDTFGDVDYEVATDSDVDDLLESE